MPALMQVLRYMVLVSLILGSVLTGCDRPPSTVSLTIAQTPQLSLSADQIDFGVLTSGAKPSQVVRLTNAGDATLQIEGVEVSCGCTAAKLDANSILPGKSSELRVTFDTVKRSTESYHGNVTIRTNDPKRSAARIAVIAQVNPRIRTSPGHLPFYDMWEGETRSVSFTVESTKNEEVELEAIVPKESGLAISLDPPHISPSSGPVQVTATVTAGWPGNYSAEISLLPSERGESPGKATVTLGIAVNGPIVVTPKQVYFVDRPEGTTAKRLSIRPANPAGDRVHVRRTEFDSDSLDVQVDQATDLETVLLVTLKPSDKATKRSSTTGILIEVECKSGMVELRVPVRILTRVGGNAS